MKILPSFSGLAMINKRFLWNEVSLNKESLGGKAEWAKEQLKKETADDLGNLLEKDVLTKENVITLLDTDTAKQNWNKKTDTPANSARYVLALQAGLKILGQNPGTIDAMWGNNTKNAVIAFQTKWNTDNPKDVIAVDGAPGPQTIGRMLQALGKTPTTQPQAQTNKPAPKPVVAQKVKTSEAVTVTEHPDEKVSKLSIENIPTDEKDFYNVQIPATTSEKVDENFAQEQLNSKLTLIKELTISSEKYEDVCKDDPNWGNFKNLVAQKQTDILNEYKQSIKDLESGKIVSLKGSIKGDISALADKTIDDLLAKAGIQIDSFDKLDVETSNTETRTEAVEQTAVVKKGSENNKNTERVLFDDIVFTPEVTNQLISILNGRTTVTKQDEKKLEDWYNAKKNNETKDDSDLIDSNATESSETEKTNPSDFIKGGKWIDGAKENIKVDGINKIVAVNEYGIIQGANEAALCNMKDGSLFEHNGKNVFGAIDYNANSQTYEIYPTQTDPEIKVKLENGVFKVVTEEKTEEPVAVEKKEVTKSTNPSDYIEGGKWKNKEEAEKNIKIDEIGTVETLNDNGIIQGSNNKYVLMNMKTGKLATLNTGGIATYDSISYNSKNETYTLNGQLKVKLNDKNEFAMLPEEKETQNKKVLNKLKEIGGESLDKPFTLEGLTFTPDTTNIDATKHIFKSVYKEQVFEITISTTDPVNSTLSLTSKAGLSLINQEVTTAKNLKTYITGAKELIDKQNTISEDSKKILDMNVTSESLEEFTALITKTYPTRDTDFWKNNPNIAEKCKSEIIDKKDESYAKLELLLSTNDIEEYKKYLKSDAAETHEKLGKAYKDVFDSSATNYFTKPMIEQMLQEKIKKIESVEGSSWKQPKENSEIDFNHTNYPKSIILHEKDSNRLMAQKYINGQLLELKLAEKNITKEVEKYDNVTQSLIKSALTDKTISILDTVKDCISNANGRRIHIKKDDISPWKNLITNAKNNVIKAYEEGTFSFDDRIKIDLDNLEFSEDTSEESKKILLSLKKDLNRNNDSHKYSNDEGKTVYETSRGHKGFIIKKENYNKLGQGTNDINNRKLEKTTYYNYTVEINPETGIATLTCKENDIKTINEKEENKPESTNN